MATAAAERQRRWQRGGGDSSTVAASAEWQRQRAGGGSILCSISSFIGFYLFKSLQNYKPRGASPLGQFLLVGPLFLCVEKVRGRK